LIATLSTADVRLCTKIVNGQQQFSYFLKSTTNIQVEGYSLEGLMISEGISPDLLGVSIFDVKYFQPCQQI
jgi:hypothetical protein